MGRATFSVSKCQNTKEATRAFVGTCWPQNWWFLFLSEVKGTRRFPRWLPQSKGWLKTSLWLCFKILALPVEFKLCQPYCISQTLGDFTVILNQIYFCLILWEQHILCTFARKWFSNDDHSILSTFYICTLRGVVGVSSLKILFYMI